MTYIDVLTDYSDIINLRGLASLIGVPRQTLEDSIRRGSLSPEVEVKVIAFMERFNKDMNTAMKNYYGKA